MSQPEPLPILWQKRVFDSIVSAFLLVLTLPLFMLFLVLIFIEHALRGYPLDPLFYSEIRISRGKPFRIYKFNIFNQRKIDALRRSGTFIHTKELEKNGGTLLFGKFLKQIYLDELPQLFNVLRGDMSLVGPRPLNLEVFANNAQDRTPAVALLLGGMTGNFQSFKNTRGKSARELNVEYVEQYRKGNGWYILFLDLRIIVRTIKVLLRAQGI